MSSEYILIVDDEPDIRQLVSEILEDEGYQVDVAENASEAREKWNKRKPDLVLLDIWMPDEDGISLLKSMKEADSLCCPVVMMSGHGTIETAVEATRLGAHDFIEKPLSMAKMLLTIENALRAGKLEHENRNLREQIAGVSNLIGSSAQMKHLRDNAQRVAEHLDTLLIIGQPGSGKEILARYIHQHSSIKDQPFIKVPVSTANDTLMSEKLFGTENSDEGIQYGAFDEAGQGIVFLSNIYALDKETQHRLLNTLKQGFYTRVGGQARIELNAHLIVASMSDLQDEVEAGVFNEELYYLLNAIPLMAPPLSEHSEDVPDLLSYYVDVFTEQEGLPYRRFSVAAQNHLRNHSWPGNIRELRNLVQRLLILGSDVEISVEEAEEALGADIPVYEDGLGKLPVNMYELPLRQAREQFEHDYISWHLGQTGGNVSRMAERVKMERTHLYRKMHSLKIDPRKFSK